MEKNGSRLSFHYSLTNNFITHNSPEKKMHPPFISQLVPVEWTNMIGSRDGTLSIEDKRI